MTIELFFIFLYTFYQNKVNWIYLIFNKVISDQQENKNISSKLIFLFFSILFVHLSHHKLKYKSIEHKKIQLASLKMKKILQSKQFITKDHYFLPQDDQSDIQSNQQKLYINENPPKSRIQIQDFTENGSIKINIEFDNQDFSQLKVISRPGKWKKPIKNTQNLQNQKIFGFQKSYQSVQNQNSLKILSQNDQITKTPVRNPVYRYDSNSSAQTVKAEPKYFYSHEYLFKDQQNYKNSFQSDKKNKRYYNTGFFNQSWGKLKAHNKSLQANFEKTNDNSPLKSQNFVSSSFYMNHLEQKPFFSASRSIIPEKIVQIQVPQNQEELQFEKQKFNKKIQIREQLSQYYISGQNSKKRFQVMKQDFNQKEILSQIYLQNQHLSRQIQDQETIPQIQIEEYIFGGSCYRKSNKNQQYVSQICEQNQKDQKRLHFEENEVKNIIKPQTVENDQSFNNKEIHKFDFNSQEQSDFGLLKQNSFRRESIKSSDSKNSQQNNHQKKQPKSENKQLIENLEDYHFQEQQYERQKLENQQVQNQPASENHQSSQKSDKQRQIDEMSQIQKLRESQIQAFSLNIDQTNTFQSQIQNQVKFRNQSMTYYEQQKVLQQKNKYLDEQIHISVKNQEFIIIQRQTQSEKSQNDQQLTYTFAPPIQTQHLQNENVFNIKQQPMKVEWQLERQKHISSKINKSKQNKLSQRTNNQESYYSKKSRSRSKQNFIPFSKKSKPHHHKEHCFQPTMPRPFIFKDYSSSKKPIVSEQYEPKSSRSNILQQQKINLISPIKQPKIVRVNLVNKKAQDLFTKHKNQFLDKLKSRQNYINQQILTTKKSRSKDNSDRKNSIFGKSKNTIIQTSRKNRPVSPYIQQLSQRLHSHTSEPVCEHYKKHSKRDLREKFFSLISEDKGSLLKQYYFSSQELHEIFIEKILNKELNENYWIEIVKKQGQKKLQNFRLRSKQRYHPNQRSIIRKQQIDADSKRAYPSFNSPFKKNYIQKIQTK